VQVYDKGVRVAAGPVKVQDIASTELVADAGDGEGIEIVAAEISFPYVLCRLSDGSLAVLKGDEESKTLVKLDVDALARLPPGGGIACATLVDDSTPAAAHGGLHDRSPGFLKRATTATATTTTTTASASREDGDDDDDSRRPMFLAVTRTGGALELYSLPSCDKAWTANGLSEGVAVLSPAGSASAALVDRDAAAAAARRRSSSSASTRSRARTSVRCSPPSARTARSSCIARSRAPSRAPAAARSRSCGSRASPSSSKAAAAARST
jgi:cleavage and polyadenylation specificity factor subunit 1